LFQLVLQFTASSLADFDELVELEERLSAVLGDSALVDGHDFGVGEFNIFIFTSDPKSTWKTAFDALKMSPRSEGMRAGFRPKRGSGYTPLWPADLKVFAVK
jgi:hypothetical protein